MQPYKLTPEEQTETLFLVSKQYYAKNSFQMSLILGLPFISTIYPMYQRLPMEISEAVIIFCKQYFILLAYFLSIYLFFAFLGRLYYSYRHKRAISNDPLSNFVVQVTWDSEKFYIDNEYMSVRWPWHCFSSIVETKKYIILLFSPLRYYVLPKRAFDSPEEQADLLHHINTAIEKKKVTSHG